MPHLRPDTIEKYSLRRLTTSQAAHAERHLFLCGTCREGLDRVEALRQTLGGGSLANADRATVTMSSSGGA
jgi:hypothetical protein